MDKEIRNEAETKTEAGGIGAGENAINESGGVHHERENDHTSLSSKNIPNTTSSSNISIEGSTTVDPESPPPTGDNAESTQSHLSPSAGTNPEDTRTKLQTTIIVLSLCASVSLAALDTTIITTAIITTTAVFSNTYYCNNYYYCNHYHCNNYYAIVSMGGPIFGLPDATKSAISNL